VLRGLRHETCTQKAREKNATVGSHVPRLLLARVRWYIQLVVPQTQRGSVLVIATNLQFTTSLCCCLVVSVQDEPLSERFERRRSAILTRQSTNEARYTRLLSLRHPAGKVRLGPETGTPRQRAVRIIWCWCCSGARENSLGSSSMCASERAHEGATYLY